MFLTRFLWPSVFPPRGVEGTVMLPSVDVTVTPADWIRKQALTALCCCSADMPSQSLVATRCRAFWDWRTKSPRPHFPDTAAAVDAQSIGWILAEQTPASRNAARRLLRPVTPHHHMPANQTCRTTHRFTICWFFSHYVIKLLGDVFLDVNGACNTTGARKKVLEALSHCCVVIWAKR